jgi:hypothetical protein
MDPDPDWAEKLDPECAKMLDPDLDWAQMLDPDPE